MTTFNDIVYTIDLRNPSDTVLPPPSPFLSFIAPPQDSNNDSWLEAVLKINLNDPSINNPYDTAEFNIEYDADPLGMTNVNIGDSQTNDGGGGDGATQSNDAELNIGNQDGNVKDLYIFARDNAPSQLLKLVPSLIPGQSSQIKLTVKNNFLAWDNNQGISGSLSSPFLYALKGQSDSEGPINYDIFAGFNRVINGSYRLGSGVGKVTVRLIDTDASANTLIVDTLVDENDGDLSPGDVSLREAIASISSGGTINFAPTLAGGKIVLTLGQLEINKDLAIQGLGANKLTVSGNNVSRVFKIDDGNVDNKIQVVIDGLTIADGYTTGGSIAVDSERLPIEDGFGGGIFNWENLTVSHSILENNTVYGHTGYGGGICNGGNTKDQSILKVVDSVIRNNKAASGGGGISSQWGTVEVTNSTISDNIASGKAINSSFPWLSGSGGGIESSSSSLTVTNSTISGNTALQSGGGIDNIGGIDGTGGTLTLIDSTVADNQADRGSGIWNRLVRESAFKITNSTITNNSAKSDAGGIYIDQYGLLNLPKISNSTISGNTAANSGGGIYNYNAAIAVTNSTITDNTADSDGNGLGDGGGINNARLGTVNIQNTIIADNSLGQLAYTGFTSPSIGQQVNSASISTSRDVFGSFISNGYNLIGDGSGSSGFNSPGDQVGTSSQPINPLLGPLGNYGGSTQTHILLTDSPARNAANPNDFPTTDQRGVTRPQGSRPDIGAFEVESNVKVGTEGSDLLNGTNGNDVIYVLGGNDTVAGGLGGDRIFGGDGDDVLRGDLNTREPQVGIGGDDLIDGGKGNDRIGGKGGKDTLYGGEDDDQIWGDDGDDLLRGGKGSDVLYGDDRSGGKGNDTLIGVEPNTADPGQAEIDTLTGGPGNDTFVLGDSDRAYYLDEYAGHYGSGSYALITDFNLEQDFIQVHDSRNIQDYKLGSIAEWHYSRNSHIPGIDANDTLILFKDDLIGVVQNVTISSADLSLI